EEQLPLDLERVVVNALVRNAHPAVLVFDRAVHVRIPNATRRGGDGLGFAIAQAGDSGAVRAVNVQRQQVVAVNAGRPRGVEVADHAIGQLKRRVSGVVRGALVGLAVLIPALRDVGRAQAGETLDVTEEILDHIL